jgi:hypothetical protein
LRQCVECVDQRDCMDSARSRCEAQHCTGCQSDADCGGRFPTTPVCERVHHVCVACSVDGDPSQCPVAMRCDPSSNSCVPARTENALAACEPCDSDAACAAGARCASPTNPPATARVCLPLAQSGSVCKTAPYRNLIPVDSAGNDHVCAPAHSCKTVLAALTVEGGAACDTNNPSTCGEGLRIQDHCLYPCSMPNDCPQPLQCQAARGVCL